MRKGALFTDITEIRAERALRVKKCMARLGVHTTVTQAIDYVRPGGLVFSCDLYLSGWLQFSLIHYFSLRGGGGALLYIVTK